MPQKSNSIAIVGAGLVGPVMALYLMKRGHQVTLYEKRKDIRQLKKNEGRSINLIITSRGLKALEELGIKQEVLAITVPVYGRMIHAKDGKQTYQPYGINESECNYSVSRNELNKILLKIAIDQGAQVQFEHELEAIDFSQKSINFQTPEGNASYSYQRLIGADGAGSLVRKNLKTQQPSFQESIEPLGVNYKELLMPSLASGEYPLDQRSLHIWPRGSFMLMGLPNNDGSFTMTLYMPSTGDNSFAQLNSDEKLFSFFKQEFPDCLSFLPNLAQDFKQNPTGHLATVRCDPWHLADQVVLIGDAAHAIVPFFGQGMNAGLEDCTLLNNLLEQENDDWSKTLENFTQEQKTNADAIAQMAIENYHEMSSHVADPKFLLKKQVEQILRVNFPADFVNRYALITYSLVPYKVALEAGIIHQEILNELCASIDIATDVDLELAKNLIAQKIPRHLIP